MKRATPWRFVLLLAFRTPPDFTTRSQAFSVLAHQAIVDQHGRTNWFPMIRKRFPNVTDQELSDDRSYARAGSHLPDLGYFPFGSREFTDLLHYVRTGDFVNRLIAEANTPEEYAFALGVMAHYEGDTVGHPLATNLAVPIIFPKLQEQYGDTVTYAESPSAHLETEFRFDILQVAHRHEIPDLFEHSLEFKVPKPFLNRVFQETYGLELERSVRQLRYRSNHLSMGFSTSDRRGHRHRMAALSRRYQFTRTRSGRKGLPARDAARRFRKGIRTRLS